MKSDSLIAQEQKTAKNGLTFTGTSVTTSANNRGHTHTINNGNTSSSGTITTAGIRHSGNTGNMSANETGTVDFDGCILRPSYSATGNVSLTTSESMNLIRATEGASSGKRKLVFNVSHTHTLPASYIYGKTDGESQNHTHSVTAAGTISGDSETRPVNYTMKIWKRIA